VTDEAAGYVGQLSEDRRWRWDGTAWIPTQTTLPAWARLDATPARWWAAAVVLVVGLLADQWLRTGAFGVGASLAIAVAAVALVFFSVRIRRTEPRLLVAAAAIFGVWLSLRASPWLLWPDLAAAAILLVTAASFARRGSLLDIGIAEAAARSVQAALHAVTGSVWAIRPLAPIRTRWSGGVPVVRGLLIAAPVALLIGGLLASADPVFASFFKLDVDLGRLVTDTFFVALGALVAAALLRLAAAEPIDSVEGPSWRLGTTEGLVVLAVLDAIFAAFAIAQLLAAAGAAGQTLRDAGVTYSDYARSGFFQLLWVAGITLIVLILFSRITGFTSPRGRLLFTALALVAIALTLLVVAVASMRLSLYEDAYGFTMLRLYSHLFAGWVAVVYLLLAADLAGLFKRRRWFVGGMSITALALLMALNVANPEAIVVGLNTDRAISSQKLDVDYLRELSSDAMPALLGSRSRLAAPIGTAITTAACSGPRTYDVTWAAYNWAEGDAVAARRSGC